MSDETKWQEKKLGNRPGIGSVSSRWIEFTEKDRLAECSYCGRLSKSDEKLPFLTKRPEALYDRYSCGCCGYG